MGVYFIAAGISKASRNREKSLDKSFFSVDLKEYLSDDISTKLEEGSTFGEQMKAAHLIN